jgi:tetratricopeptide (TPR) repeat protein
MKYWMLGLLLLLIPTVAAQDSITAAVVELPASQILDGFSWIHQGVNRCSAAAMTIHLSFYEDVTVETYNELATEKLNTFGADASVRIEEMAAEAEARGLNAIVRRGGTVDMLRQLVAGGFPALVENSYYEGDDLYRHWLSHNRILVGYDDATRMFSFQDPLLGFPDGDLVTYSYEDFDVRWKPFNRDYMVIYTDEQEAALQAILGDQWDDEFNATWTMNVAQEEIDSGADYQAHSYFNLGWAQLQLGLNEEAAASFDRARELGLPMRMLWYEFGPFEAYNAVGRYQDTLNVIHANINVAGNEISIEEWYFYAGQAYEGLGDRERALLNYQVALTRNNNYTAAAERLQALQG